MMETVLIRREGAETFRDLLDRFLHKVDKVTMLKIQGESDGAMLFCDL